MGLPPDSSSPNYGMLILLLPVILIILVIYIFVSFLIIKIVNKHLKTSINPLKSSILLGICEVICYPISTFIYNLINNNFVDFNNIPYKLNTFISYFIFFTPTSLLTIFLAITFLFRKENLKIRYKLIISFIIVLMISLPFITKSTFAHR